MGTLQRIDWLAGIKRLNPGAVKGYEPFFHGSSQSQAAHTSSCLNGLDVVVNYNYERVARPVDVVSGSIGQRPTLIWTGWMSHRWVYSAVPALFIWSYCCLIGWLVGRFHPTAPVQMVTSFAIFLCLYEGGHIVAEAQNPNAFASVIVVWACRDIGAIFSVVVGGILVARAKHFQPSRLKAEN